MVRPRIELRSATPSPEADGSSSRVAFVEDGECVRLGGVPPAQAAGESSGLGSAHDAPGCDKPTRSDLESTGLST